MPKKGKQVQDLSGGVNTYADPQNIADNELAHSSGFKPELGEVIVLGDMKAAYSLGSHTAAEESIDIEAGYGVFTFSGDYDKDGALASTDYYVIQNGSQLNIYDNTANAWVDNQIDMGTGASDTDMSSFKPCFFFIDGALRVSPGNFAQVDSGAETNGNESIAAGFEDRIGLVTTIAVDAAKANAGDIVVIDGAEYFIILQDIGGAGVDHVAIRNTTGLFASKYVTGTTVNVMPDAKWRGIVNRRLFSSVTTAGTFVEWYTCPMAPRPPASVLGTGDLDDTVLVEVPFQMAVLQTGNLSSAGTGFESGVLAIGTKSDETNADGVWDTTIRFWITALYDDAMQESQPFLFSGTTTETIAAGEELGVVVNVQYSDDGNPAYCLNKRVVGARLYYEDTVDELGALYQLLDIDFEKGCKKAESESYTPWVARTANQEAICPTTDGHLVADRHSDDAFVWSVPPKVFTYEINTGYPATTNIHARFKTAVVANRRLYVGNVYQGGRAYGDRILYSPVNKFDLLPEVNVLPLAVGDGDEIVKLASFADRLLSFKKRTLYIINIGGGALSAFIESQHANMGVENPCQVCDTEYGPAWVNKFGVFLYDGQKIVELTRGKLQLSNSTRGLGLNIVESLSPLIGYHPLNKWIVVHSSSLGQVTGTTYAAVDSNPDTITDSANGFITAGFVAGEAITVSGSSESGNNTTHIVDTVAAGTLTLSSASTLTADGAGDTWIITKNAATEAWMYDFKNGSWTWSQEFTADADFKTNMISTHDNELVFAGGINSSNNPDFFKYQDTGVSDPATDKLFLLTKDFTLDIPSVGKTIYGVSITYESAGDSKIEVDFITTSASGVTTTTGATSDDSLYHVTNGFQTTGGVKKTVEIKPSSTIRAVNSFQLRLKNDAAAYDSSACAFKLYNITFIYRDKSVR